MYICLVSAANNDDMEKVTFIGRKEEQSILMDALQSAEAEMVALIGRRRVGKTFLVKTVYKKEMVFEITGIQDGSAATHLERFRDNLMEALKTKVSVPVPKDWFEAFKLLKEYLQTLPSRQKHVLFFDELPWLATHKSNFLQAFGYFWNSWAWQQNLVVVICGSAASWMIQKVVNDTGGLHNRITKRIFLQPFTLAETEEYLKSRSLKFNRYQIVQLYMAMGGIPHYLKEIKDGKSATQNINDICFSPNGLLQDEFQRLYPSLFPNAERHFSVIRALSDKQGGLTRQEIAAQSRLTDGGGLTTVLDELAQSGFISTFYTFGKATKDKVYRLTDEYSLFYLKFIENKAWEGADIWNHLSQTQAFKTWSGYAFENLCLKHIPQIKKSLGISGIYSLSHTFYAKGTDGEKGLQVDLLIDRNDYVINLFEIKFHNKEFVITKEYADSLRQKMWRFEELTKTKKQIFWVFISAFGLAKNEHSTDIVSQSLTIDHLF
jgi:hypothetical protein